MKTYFAGSIRGGREDRELYSDIINHLKKYGEVLTEHIGVEVLREPSDREIYQRDISWIKEADIFIAEISTPSLGVGYEIAKAEELGKKILCFYNKSSEGKKVSAMIMGNSGFTTKEYSNLKDILKDIDEFLTQTGSNVVPQAELIRRLI
jgi:hypothetical protein